MRIKLLTIVLILMAMPLLASDDLHVRYVWDAPVVDDSHPAPTHYVVRAAYGRGVYAAVDTVTADVTEAIVTVRPSPDDFRVDVGAALQLSELEADALGLPAGYLLITCWSEASDPLQYRGSPGCASTPRFAGTVPQ